MKEELISVIIPVYNVEKYLNRCIESVINQTYTNLEIILVDDGSTDNSGKMCDEFAKQDSRIKVIHKKNGGLSDARNIGIENSSGKYISFVDSDDFLTSDYAYVLYSNIVNNSADISIANYKVINEKDLNNSTSAEITNKIKCYNKIESLKKMLIEDDFTISACSKLYKRELFDNVRFPVGKMYEDVGTLYYIFDKSNKVVYTPDSKYFYLKRKNSITTKAFSIKNYDMIELTDKMCNYLKKYSQLNSEIIKRIISSRITIINLLIESDMKKETKKYIDEIRNECKKIRNKNVFTLRDKIAINLLKINVNLYGFIWKNYKKIKYRSTI